MAMDELALSHTCELSGSNARFTCWPDVRTSCWEAGAAGCPATGFCPSPAGRQSNRRAVGTASRAAATLKNRGRRLGGAGCWPRAARHIRSRVLALAASLAQMVSLSAVLSNDAYHCSTTWRSAADAVPFSYLLSSCLNVASFTCCPLCTPL